MNTNATGWGASDPYYRMYEADANDYNYSIPDIRSYYGVAGDTTHIDSIALLVSNGPGTIQTSNFYIPLAAMHSYTSTPAGIATISYNVIAMSLSPNPATDEVWANVSLSNTPDATIRVINETGQCVMVKNIGNQSSKVTLQLDGMAAGVYFVELTAGQQKVTQRLIKE